jgi:exodeoxyribonuclease VII large subunit
LKDQLALLPSLIFNRTAKDVKFKIEDGLKVICFGKVEVYPPRGQYQLVVAKIEPKGIGSLQLALEQLKERLEKEGLFSIEHKRPLPYLPGRIGVVTSVQGAAIKDILKVLDRRFKDIHIIINPVRVQGEGAKEEIARAIKDFNLLNEELPKEEHLEIMIVGRGGGSIEDLWAFNEEVVARAIYNSKIPVVSAVGHERDWTIADLVADLRAPTPSAAAELIIPKREDLSDKLQSLTKNLKGLLLVTASNFQETIDDLKHRLTLIIAHTLELSMNRFSATNKKLSLLNPVVLLEQYKIKSFDLAKQIYTRTLHFIKLKESEFINKAGKLSTLSPLNILSRGYSITFQMPQGEIIKASSYVKPGDTIKTKLHKGGILSQVTEVTENG